MRLRGGPVLKRAMHGLLLVHQLQWCDVRGIETAQQRLHLILGENRDLVHGALERSHCAPEEGLHTRSAGSAPASACKLLRAATKAAAHALDPGPKAGWRLTGRNACAW